MTADAHRPVSITARELAALGALAIALAVGIAANSGRAPARVRVIASGDTTFALARIDINTADAVDLDALPGIGPKLAAAIIADRDARGAFPAVDSLARVRGIGRITVDRLRPYVEAGAHANVGERDR